uniref:ADAMTS-like 3 n=1 Tax=Scophthalmus maximus TaxID=52904 RepID=A0A8D3B2Y6_SCOMX
MRSNLNGTKSSGFATLCIDNDSMKLSLSCVCVCVCCQCAESEPQSAVFLPEYALSPQGSFMEDATEDQFLTYRYDDQASRMTRSDEDRDTGWDAWGPWSDCSRTCGGGASYSLRRCLNGGSCDDKNIRYRTCSNTDCPLESGDFRAQQCSAHNDIKYQGATYDWVPAPYDPSAPCILQCQAKGRSLTVELAPKVLDGTRCRADALDMCINGVCQEVGCDRQLASGAREDNCGVCGGEGSTCRLVRGQTLPHLTPEQFLEVPLGSRFLRLSAKGPDVLAIEAVPLQGRKEETSLVTAGSYVIGNTSLDFQRGTDRQTLRTHGPLNADFIIKMKYGGPKDTVVQFLFYQPIRYQWRESDFFPCSVTCGGGYQLNSAECTDIRSNQTLPEHHCNSYPENTKPMPKLKECNMDPCKEGDGFKEVMPYDHFQPLPRWEQGPWTQCSVSCGGGWQDRSVMCVEEDSHGQFSEVEKWKCTHSPGPVTRQICNTFSCPQWVAMEWSQCTVTCGRGLRYRVVLCIDHRGQHIGGCEASLKPHVKEDCLVPIACHKPRESVPVEAKVPWLKQAHELEKHHTATEDPTFVPGPWAPCSTTCGLGKQTREVKCNVMLSFTKTEVDLPEDECGKERPQLERRCNQGPCTQVPGISSGLQDHGAPYTQMEELYSWDYRSFTACSATCAAGKQTAAVRCLNRKQGDEVEDSLCNSSSRPPVMTRICNPEPCPARWEVTSWTSCSVSCGVGIQTRSVFCMRLLSIDQQDILSVSEEDCRELKSAILQPCNQVDCPPVWEAEPWQLCSQSCGGGVQLRKVYCKQLLSTGAYRRLADKACWGPKPATNRTCSNTDCLPYLAGGEWGKCSVSCGLGIQHREQLCHQLMGMGHQVTLDRVQCSGLSSPPLLRTCRMMACPSKLQTELGEVLVTYHHIYIQTHKEKRLYLTVGGHAYLFPNTSLVIKCPVRSSKHLDINKSGSLKIHFVTAADIGVYKCVAGPASDIFTLQLIGLDSRSNGRVSTTSPGPNREEMLPSCHSHYSNPNPFWPAVSVSLVPPGTNNLVLLLFLMLCLDVICSTDSLPNWSEHSSLDTAVNRPRIIRQQRNPPLPFQKKVNVSIGHTALLTNSTRSLTILCPAEGFPPPKISWTKDGVLLQHTDRVSWDSSGGHNILQPRVSDRGQYKCTAANMHGSDSETSQLLVAVIISHCNFLFPMNFLLIPLRLAGVPPPTVTWRRKSGPLDPGAISLPSGSLWIRNISLHNRGIYSCTATNTIGKSTASALLQVNGGFSHKLHEFGWRFGDWTTCSASCGNRGTWLRRIHCVTLDGKALSPPCVSAYQIPSRPLFPATDRTAPPVAPVVCGSGFQSRRVDCVHRRSGRTLADQHCAWLLRPSTWQHCNTSTCGSKCVCVCHFNVSG